jgi:hypothetical protein
VSKIQREWHADKGPVTVQLFVELDHLHILLIYRFPRTDWGQGHWSVQQSGTAAEIATFIEKWVPTSPDPALMDEALQELSTQIPPGVL